MAQPWETLDEWQERVIKAKGNIVLRSGRQVGKSLAISVKVGEYAVNNKDKVVLIIAATERQAKLMLEKILAYLYGNYKSRIREGKSKPTQSKVCLKNGTVIHSLPAGNTGYGIRGYTVDMLVADEAAFIEEAVWNAVTPMMAVTGGDIVLLSTPLHKSGYYYKCFQDPKFTAFHISSEDCPRIPKDYLEQERLRHGELVYAREYLGEFVDELKQFFPDELIAQCCTKQIRGDALPPLSSSFLGVDVARMGGDETVLLTLRCNQHNHLEQMDMEIYTKIMLTDTVRFIKNADSKWKYKRIYIDDGGMGVGVFDPLLEDSQTKRKVVAINNASRSIDKGNRRKKLLKEDLYNNLLYLMQKNHIQLWDEPEIRMSLKSIQAEWKGGELKISGSYSHITEAIIRAAWCLKDKGLNIWITYS